MNPPVTITMTPEAARWLLAVMEAGQADSADIGISPSHLPFSSHLIAQLTDELSPLNQPPGKPFPKFEE